jgi:hypothetical protein
MAPGASNSSIIICMSQIVCSGALLYALDTNRFLFLHRTQGKHKDLWGLVGGTNEGVETPWEGLVREIQEDLISKKLFRWKHLYPMIHNLSFIPISQS